MLLPSKKGERPEDIWGDKVYLCLMRNLLTKSK